MNFGMHSYYINTLIQLQTYTNINKLNRKRKFSSLEFKIYEKIITQILKNYFNHKSNL